MRELDEVARVEPAALEVHLATERRERTSEDDVAVGVLVAGPGVPAERAVVQVRPLAVEPPGNHVGAVALRLEERDDVGDAITEEHCRRADREGRRLGCRRARDLDAVGPRCGQCS